MPTIKNRSPYGDLDVPLLRQTVEAGAEVEVTDAQAGVLLAQIENWEPVGDAAETIAAQVALVLDAENDAESGPPAKSAPKAAWVGYAIALGDDAAEDKTKEQLINEYGETS